MLSIEQATDGPGRGFAWLVFLDVEGAAAAAEEEIHITFQRLDTGRFLGGQGWQDRRQPILPVAVEAEGQTLRIMVGPLVVNQIEPGTGLRVLISPRNIGGETLWPDIPPFIGALPTPDPSPDPIPSDPTNGAMGGKVTGNGQEEDVKGQDSDDGKSAKIAGGKIKEGKDTDGKDTDGKDRDGKDADGKDADGKDADGKDTDGKDADGKDADGKDADGKDADDEEGTKPVIEPPRVAVLAALALVALLAGLAGGYALHPVLAPDNRGFEGMNVLLSATDVPAQSPTGVPLDTAETAEERYAFAMRAQREQRSEEAEYWFRAAAALGNGNAANELAGMYFTGDGVRKDRPLAIELWEVAGAVGTPRALFNLGFIHEKGNGVPKDLTRAEYYYERSARLGNSRAEGALDALRERVSEATSN